jgi:hypothetical protein
LPRNKTGGDAGGFVAARASFSIAGQWQSQSLSLASESLIRQLLLQAVGAQLKKSLAPI